MGGRRRPRACPTEQPSRHSRRGQSGASHGKVSTKSLSHWRGSPHPGKNACATKSFALPFGGPQVANAIVHSEAI